ncbi:glutamate 5-kinase [Terrilactibacillus laevilacticus]|uniref:Glutamate 5-kinase n=1 Tax=Terrilactibacillus laevilacticus TaxID=1380157 RepID=A0ABW5PUD4_9BACI|nr:glutamate 5-kinase [Terrilactibacillus laevilacticus]
MRKKRIVVKIGSSSLTNSQGEVSDFKLKDHTDAISRLKQNGHDVIIVSSGAVASGYSGLGYPARPVTIAGKQAAAAVGQVRLLNAYATQFLKHDLVCAQLLLTRQDFQKREQMTHAYSALSELLKRNVIPIINENDSVSLEELTFGDNDMLSALVSGLVHADLLIILTDINGLYDDNPHHNPNAKRYNFLPDITNELLGFAKSTSRSKVGTGGMKSKLLAAQTALSLGVRTFIGTGEGANKCLQILQGHGDGTYIGDENLKPSLKVPEQWIALHSPVSGNIEIDDGAVKALLEQGKSLLPAGIKHINGHFSAGEVIQLLDRNNHVLGKGQVNYSSDTLRAMKQLSNQDSLEFIPKQHPEVIHRDNWVSYKKWTD